MNSREQFCSRHLVRISLKPGRWLRTSAHGCFLPERPLNFIKISLNDLTCQFVKSSSKMAEGFTQVMQHFTKQNSIAIFSCGTVLAFGIALNEALGYSDVTDVFFSFFTNWIWSSIYFIGLSVLALVTFKSKSKIM
jgi:hypothetical protein